MSKIFVLVFLPALAFSASVDPVTDKLEEIHREYHATAKDGSDARIQLLIKLDQDLRGLIDKPFALADRTIDGKYWKQKYQAIGVGIGHYNDVLGYSGKLLVEARALDRSATYTSWTHYADVCNGAGSFGDCVMPNPTAALLYEKEFPQGPFIEDTLSILGMFYDDLFKVVEMSDGYKYDCFSKYIRHEPIPLQRERARKTAIFYYNKVLTLDSQDQAWMKSIRQFRSGLESGQSVGWHFCDD
jgi:hypothetical protein